MQSQSNQTDQSELIKLKQDLKECRHEIEELSSDQTAIKIDIQKLRSTNQKVDD